MNTSPPLTKGLHHLRRSLPKLHHLASSGFGVVGLASLAIVTSLLGLESGGILQKSELRAYDTLVQGRQYLIPNQGTDPRILVVGITEDDIQRQQRVPLSDQVILGLLQQINRHQPAIIGLDLHRDVPQEPGRAALLRYLTSPASRTIVITKLADELNPGVPPPPGVPPERIGFNDVVLDPDTVVRRNLLSVWIGPEVYYSLGLRVALAYLEPRGILPQAQPEGVQLGQQLLRPLTPSAGAYLEAEQGGYQILLNYRVPQPAFQQVTLTEVLEGQVKGDWIRDRVVLIGYTAPSEKDVFLTPFSSGQVNPEMPGVLLHAHKVSQLLDLALDEQAPFWFWPDYLEGVWLVTWSLLGGFLAWRIHHPLRFLLGDGLLVVLLLGISGGIFHLGGWIPTVAPLLATLLTGTLVVTYRGYQAQQQQKIVMRLLGQNTSPEIATALWESRDRLLKSGILPGQNLTATMMFTDLRGFSTVSEQLAPEELLTWLNQLLGALTREVQHHHGIVNKFTGDGLMAVFGVPLARTTPEEIAADARNAVACALQMAACLDRINQVQVQQGLPKVQMRVGIFTGPIVAGSLGGKERMEYGVIGDSVNIASRLESCEKDRQVDDCRVLIAQETLDYLGPEFPVESWGPLALKGKQQLVHVYRVLPGAESKS